MKLTLKAARVNSGLTQKDAANRLNVTNDTIGNWERGKSFPDAVAIGNIEKVYGVRYDELIFLPKNNALSVN
ncbi:MAG: helix-turn-helix transcriptional regulator [Ruthenibacterium sp.]